jgi:hypothetical protein
MGSKLNCHVEFCNTILFKKGVVNREIKKLYNTVTGSIKKMENFELCKKN